MNRTENAFRLLSGYLHKSAHDYPDKTALVCNTQRISYKEFYDKTEILAKYLLKIGVKKHDRIAYLMEIQPEFFYLYMAAARIGAIIVGMGTKLMPPELKYIIQNSEAEYIFATGGDAPYVGRLAEVLPDCPSVKQVFVAGEKAETLNAITLEEVFREEYKELDQALAEREAQVDTDDGLLMVYTSGTTGKPKGAILSHRNIIHSSLIEADVFESTDDDVYLDNMPVNHVGGTIVAGSTPIITASTIVLLAKFSPTKTLQLIEKEKVSILGQIPTQYTMEFSLADYDKYDKSSLRVVHFGGALPSVNTLEKVFATMTTNVFNCLGMTEASGIVCYTPKGANIDILSRTVGRGIPEVEWKLVDKNRKPVAKGEVGEIAYRGSTIIRGYYKLPEATAQAIDEEGWFYAGDLLREDKNGYLEFMGRKHDMYITGGENVYPAEVEEAIGSYDPVESVAVLPAPDPIYGDIGYAFIVPKAGCTIDEEELKSYLQTILAKYKIPKKFIIRSKLPLTPSAKIARKDLKQEIAEKFKNASEVAIAH